MVYDSFCSVHYTFIHVYFTNWRCANLKGLFLFFEDKFYVSLVISIVYYIKMYTKIIFI